MNVSKASDKKEVNRELRYLMRWEAERIWKNEHPWVVEVGKVFEKNLCFRKWLSRIEFEKLWIVNHF